MNTPPLYSDPEINSVVPGTSTADDRAGATYAVYPYRKCPFWAMINAMEGKGPRSDRCGPKCHLFDQTEGDCVFHVIARRLSNEDIG